MVDIWSAGNYGHVDDSTKRLARPLCFIRTENLENGYVSLFFIFLNIFSIFILYASIYELLFLY